MVTGRGPVARLDSLTGLRFFAAFAVFAFHSLRYGNQSLGFELYSAGATGVSFFYVVSGFVMSWTARPGDTAGSFYRRRFARIYPAYAVAWLVSLAILVTQGRRPSWVDLLPLTLTQSWFPSSTFYWATNAVFWSLSCEAFFYLVFPFVDRLLAPLSTRALAATGVALVAVSELVAVVVHLLVDGRTAFWVGSVLPPVRLPEFVLGMVMGMLLRRGVRCAVPLSAASVLAVAAFLAAGHVPIAFQLVAVTVVPFALVVWSAASADVAGTRSVFRARALVVLGTWSYAFYLVHTQVLTVWFEVLQRLGVDKHALGGPSLFLALCVACAGGLLAAWLLHRFVEVPMERRLRPRSAGPNSVLDQVPVRPARPVDPHRDPARDRVVPPEGRDEPGRLVEEERSPGPGQR